MTDGWEFVEISATDTHPLRLAVLRFDTPTKEVAFVEDDWPGSWHLGVRMDGELVGTSSWVPRPHQGRHAVQLRGMATTRHLQSIGLGGQLLEHGCDVAHRKGFELVWARARDAALGFYTRHQFAIEGEGFIDETTRLPHHLIVRDLI